MGAEVDSLAFFDALANEMNSHPERFAPLGEAEMIAAVVMHRPDGDFCVRLDFEGLGCSGVVEMDAVEARRAEFRLEGQLHDWQDMFDDVATHGRATGLFTINSLALLGDRIACLGDDPMGLDKFSRYNQTLQEFLDGAGRLLVETG